jgi:tRNA nucleotidyltransferase (CCA-adding enzyme)
LKTYLVGGAVRDQLLGYPIKERDYVVVGATPEQMLAKGFRLVGKDFPVFLHPRTHEEYALARTERKVGPGYTGFSCYAAPDVTLEEDLQRRDLTINAIAQASSGKIIDPYHGKKDIANRFLRHVSPAFSEDPVRLLRVARFMAKFSVLGFRVAKETMQLLKTMVKSGEINTLIPERVWQEFARALTEVTPQAFIKTLFDCGALAILFPPLQKLYVNFNQKANKKQKSSSLAVLEQAVNLTTDPQVRFAALLCHLGKELVPHQPSTDAGILSIQHLCKTYHIPNDFSSLAIIAARYHLFAHRALALDANALLNLLEKTDALRRPNRFKQFLLVCEADFHAYSCLDSKPYLQKDRLQAVLFAVKTISAEPLVKQGWKGATLGKKLRKQRQDIIAKLIADS